MPLRVRCAAGLLALACLLVLPSSGWADSVATTQAATSVTFTSAQLNGTVNATDPDSTYWFEYGTTTSYGQMTQVTAIGTGSQQVSATVSNLTPAATYHFRLVVVEGSYMGTEHDGDDLVFTTPALNAVATTGNATSITNHSAQLNGVVNTTNPDSAWAFQYGTGTTYSNTTKVQAVGAGVTVVAATISGLKRSTTYHFRLVVVQGSYQGVYSTGADVTFKTNKFPYGRLRLRRKRLRVAHGHLSVPLKCGGTSGALCKGRVKLTVKDASGTSVACASGRVSAHAVKKFKLRRHVRGKCLALLGRAKGHELTASVTATLVGNQGAVTLGSVVLFE